MLTRVSVPLSAYSRVVLTGLSACLALVLGSGLVLAGTAQAAVLKPAVTAASPAQWASTVQDRAIAKLRAEHAWHKAHLAHLAALEEKAEQARAYAAYQARQKKLAELHTAAVESSPVTPEASPAAATAPAAAPVAYSGGGVLTAAEVGQLWLGAGGPAYAEAQAVQIADCESGFNPDAYNPSGATGIWQILGQVTGFGGSLTNPEVNAANAVAKFTASGDNFSAWVCQ